MKQIFENNYSEVVVPIAPLKPSPPFADVGAMVRNIQNAILGILARLICMGGNVFSGFKFEKMQKHIGERWPL